MATLMLDEGEADFEIEYVSVEEYRERLDRARVKMAQFLVGCAQVMVNKGQSVISSPTIGRGNLRLCKIELKNFCEDSKDFLKFQVNFREYLMIQRRETNFSV